MNLSARCVAVRPSLHRRTPLQIRRPPPHTGRDQAARSPHPHFRWLLHRKRRPLHRLRSSTIRREADRNPQFGEALRTAHLNAELNPLHALRRAAQNHWRAAAWLLERFNPQRFAKQDPRRLTPQQLQACMARAAQVVAEEVKDAGALARVCVRFDQLTADLDREMSRRRVPSSPRADALPPHPNSVQLVQRGFARCTIHVNSHRFARRQRTNPLARWLQPPPRRAKPVGFARPTGTPFPPVQNRAKAVSFVSKSFCHSPPRSLLPAPRSMPSDFGP